MLYINILSILITILLIAVIYIFRGRLLRDFNVFIRRVALVVFLSGFVIYFIGYREGSESLGTSLSWYASIFRPLLSSLEMFAFDSGLLEVGEGCKHSMVYMTLFATIHFAAAAVSFAVAINYIGVRFKSSWRLFLLRRKKHLKGDVEVFFGINDVSLRLAKDIHAIRPDDTLIFLNAPEEGSQENMLSFASMFNFFSFRRDIMSEIDGINAIIIQIKRPIQNMHGSDVLHQLKLDDILAKTRDYLGFYMIYDDQLKNIAKTLKLRNDDYFRTHISQKAYIFCRATKGKMNGGTAFEYNSKYGAEIILVDAAQLTAKSLMNNTLSHPVNYVGFNPATGVANSAFHCMIIGFGETGQEIFKFLYEHGQFVYPEGFQGSHMVCHIVDPKANEKRGFFEMRYPSLRRESGFSPLSVEIQWHNHTAGDGRFWELMQGIRDSLNYVVVATGSDNRDIAISYDLCEYVLRWRRDSMYHFGIFVRAYEQSNECRYDELCSACLDDAGRPVVHTIGKLSESFSPRYMWKNLVERDAAVFSSVLESTDESFVNTLMFSADEAYNYWWLRHGEAKGDVKAYAEIMEREYQDFSDAIHIYTKKHILGLDNPENAICQLNSKSLSQCETLDDLRKLPFFHNLVVMEHLRNVASHESIGYSPMTIDEFNELGGVSECDPERHKLLTMVAWDKLDSLPVASRLHGRVPESQFCHAYKYLLEQTVQASLAILMNQKD